jgi:hypothetical protein
MRFPAAAAAARNGQATEAQRQAVAPIRSILLVEDSSSEEDKPADVPTHGFISASDDAGEAEEIPSDFEDVGYLRP